jgi:lipopolysaccharide biosynthesis protein
MHSLSNSTSDAAHTALSSLPNGAQKSDGGIVRDRSKLIAFYLPQFHRIPENSEWWGAGFTEWTNVAKGRPNFEGHYQPHIPKDLGFYDLDNKGVMREQAEYARLYGIAGFCFHYYWFSGRRILEKPIDNFLKSDIQIDFCFCWANENWTRTWDGDSERVLLEQKYSDGDEECLIQSMAEAFRDPRYICVESKPVLVVYRAKHIPNPIATIIKWRAEAVRLGFPGLHVVAVDFYDIADPCEVGADALVEFPPHKFNGPNNHPDNMPTLINPQFSGGIVDYRKVIMQSALRKRPRFTLYRGIVPSWDNTARRQDSPTILINAEPTLYGAWLRFLRSYTQLSCPSSNDNFIFINAWNEWGEGCHLEPDLRWGLRYLEETYRSAFSDVEMGSLADPNEAKLDYARASLLQQLAKCASSETRSTNVQFSAGQPSTYRPTSSFVRLIAAKLASRPLLYWAAKGAYKTYVRVFR